MNNSQQPSSRPAPRMPGLLSHALVLIYDDVRPLTEFVKSGKRVVVSTRLQGWWCQARGFGEAEFALHYEAEAPVIEPKIPGDATSIAEAKFESFERQRNFEIECESVLADDIAMGRQFFVSDRSGKFIAAMVLWCDEKEQAIVSAIEEWSRANDETPAGITDMIARLGVRPEEGAQQ